MTEGLTAAIIGAGAQLAATGANWAVADASSGDARGFAEKMYDRQLQDNIRLWQMNNDYNSPANQMARLKAAGLNPNLVYGRGADNTASSPNAPSQPSWRPNVPDMSGIANINPIATYQNFQQQKATTDNLRKQNEAIQAGIDKTRADIIATMEGSELTKSQRIQLNKFSDYQLDALMASIRNTEANTKATLDQNERSALTTNQSLMRGVEEIIGLRIDNQFKKSNYELNQNLTREQIKNLKEARNNLQSDNTLKQLEIKLKNLGITWSDPIIARGIALGLNSISNNPSGPAAKIASAIAANIPAPIAEFFSDSNQKTPRTQRLVDSLKNSGKWEGRPYEKPLNFLRKLGTFKD